VYEALGVAREITLKTYSVSTSNIASSESWLFVGEMHIGVAKDCEKPVGQESVSRHTLGKMGAFLFKVGEKVVKGTPSAYCGIVWQSLSTGFLQSFQMLMFISPSHSLNFDEATLFVFAEHVLDQFHTPPNAS
jgi:hypothetical protein